MGSVAVLRQPRALSTTLSSTGTSRGHRRSNPNRLECDRLGVPGAVRHLPGLCSPSGFTRLLAAGKGHLLPQPAPLDGRCFWQGLGGRAGGRRMAARSVCDPAGRAGCYLSPVPGARGLLVGGCSRHSAFGPSRAGSMRFDRPPGTLRAPCWPCVASRCLFGDCLPRLW